MTQVAIVYYSGFGHTAKVAEHVKKGADAAGATATLYKAEDLSDADTGPWDKLHAADAIIFGSPTYMGSAAGPMKQFMDATSKAWFADKWKDKIAAGFSNSGSLSGDKVVTLQQFAALAAQHGMVWVPMGMKSGYGSKGDDIETAHNRAGHYLGLGTQAKNDMPPEEAPDQADLETAEAFGKRVAQATMRWQRGQPGVSASDAA